MTIAELCTITTVLSVVVTPVPLTGGRDEDSILAVIRRDDDDGHG